MKTANRLINEASLKQNPNKSTQVILDNTYWTSIQSVIRDQYLTQVPVGYYHTFLRYCAIHFIAFPPGL